MPDDHNTPSTSPVEILADAYGTHWLCCDLIHGTLYARAIGPVSRNVRVIVRGERVEARITASKLRRLGYHFAEAAAAEKPT